MGRKAAPVPSYLKHTKGNARCIINGVTYYLGPFGSPESRLRYDTLIAEYLASGRSPTFGQSRHQRVYAIADLIVGYMAFCKEHYPVGAGSETESTKYALRPLARLYRDLPAHEFGPLQFKTVRDEWLQPNKKGVRPSRGYINAQMKRIVRMFRWAAEEMLVSADVHATLKLIRPLQQGRTAAPEAKPVIAVDPKIVEATLPHCPPIIADMIRLQLATGARPGELCRLKPGDIDRSADVWVARLDRHKTAHHGKGRALFFGPRSQAILTKYIKHRPDDVWLFSPLESVRRRIAQAHADRVTPLNCGNRPGSNAKPSPRKRPGLHYTTQSYTKAIRRACIAAKVPIWTANQLRHTAATNLRASHGLDVAGTILGHSRLEVTQIYAEKDYHTAMRIMAEIG